jgi:hypothetical protein
MVEADSPAGVLAEQRDQRLLEVAVDTPLRTAIPHSRSTHAPLFAKISLV